MKRFSERRKQMAEKIQIVRLTTGEELLTKVERSEDTVTLKDIAILIPAGEGKLAFAPWLPYSDVDSGVEINMKDIMFICNPQSELEQQYLSAITGILVPDSSVKTAGDMGMGGPQGQGLKLTT